MTSNLVYIPTRDSPPSHLILTSIHLHRQNQPLAANMYPPGEHPPPTAPLAKVGAASQRPPGVELVVLPGCGRTLQVHESSWQDAGLAWRIWGAARIMAHAIDAAVGGVSGSGGGGDGGMMMTEVQGKSVLELGRGGY